MATETKTFYPGAYDQSDYSYYAISNETNPLGKGSNNSTFAKINLNGSGAENWIYWPFELSAIPVGATIDKVVCKAKIALSSSSLNYYRTRTLQLYSGSVAKGSATTISSLAATTYQITAGTWTRSELSNCRLKIYVVRTSSGSATTSYASFYGADLTVTYTYQSEKFMLKLDGAWHDIARVFKKVSGIWVEQTDLANVIEDGVRYQNGGEYVSPVKKISFTINGTSYQAEEGMTWGEWVASSYNTAGYQIVYNETQSGIADASGTKVVFDLGNRIFPPSTDAIANGREYTLLQA